ncbi:GNAT family N-acetyltransferase [Nonomuraea zeae]|uniref:GNAT family N-acetyltransferase n=1 Tax=Nonomuraea zeae TaxID=1642303 RepID=A0A5S4FSV4_9ACTN|nr:GNAT family N-acetyltransferase [Nonomuraea zeae]TMR23702.1 GNAT family N-acetyltransferase [Nonomuraea zeae]
MVRAATEADMPAVRRVARRFGLLGDWPAAPDFLDAERLFGTLLLGPGEAEAGGPGGTEGTGGTGGTDRPGRPGGTGGALGFGGTLRRGSMTHLGDLFVLPEHQSSGLGRALLATLLDGDGPRITFASSDHRALALYVRYGLRPWTPLLYLTGPAASLTASAVEPAGMSGPAAAVVEPTGLTGPVASVVEPATAAEVAALDAHVSGGYREETLAWYADVPGVTVHTTGHGYAFARRTAADVLIGPAGGTTPEDGIAAVLGALAATGARSGRIAVPGPHPILPLLIGAGWRIQDMDTLMADDPARTLLHPDRYLPHPDLG